MPLASMSLREVGMNRGIADIAELRILLFDLYVGIAVGEKNH
jgi:hypothetical protein